MAGSVSTGPTARSARVAWRPGGMQQPLERKPPTAQPRAQRPAASRAATARCAAPPRFQDVTAAVGIDPIRLASGALGTTAGSAWLDWDADGHVDLLLGGDELPVQLHRSLGPPEYRFEDATLLAGLDQVTGVVAMDVAQVRGAPTLVLMVRGAPTEGGDRVQIWRLPEAGGAFERTGEWGFPAPFSATHGDLDGDGDQDVVISLANGCVPRHHPAPGLWLLENDFGLLRHSLEAPWPAPGCAAMAAVTDYDANRRPVVLVANDFGNLHTPCAVIRSDGMDASLPRLYGMGIAAGDFNGDLVTDYYLTSIREDALWVSGPTGRSRALLDGMDSRLGRGGVRAKMGAVFLDADNDGELDLYAAAGQVFTTPLFASGPLQESLFFRNRVDIAAEAGLATDSVDTTVAVADYDADGRLDLLVGAVSAWHLFRNVTEGAGHFLQLAIPDAPGTTARATCGGRTWHAEWVGGTSGVFPQPLLHFGLGDCAGPVDVVGRWPWAGETHLTGLAVDRRVPVTRTPTIRVEPAVVAPGDPVTVTYEGPGTDVRWDGTPLEGTPWRLVRPAPEATGDIRIQLTVDGVALGLRPRLRVAATDAVVARTDPTPLRRDRTGRVHLSSQRAGVLDVASAEGADLLKTKATGPGACTARVRPTAAVVTLRLRVDGAPFGEAVVLDAIPAVDAVRTRLSVTPEEAGLRVAVIPLDRYGSEARVHPDDVTLVRNGVPDESIRFDWSPEAGLSTVVPNGGVLTAVVEGVVLDAEVRTGDLIPDRPLDPERSRLFPLYGTAFADGQDIVTVLLRAVDPQDQHVELTRDLPVTADGLTPLDHASPLCSEAPDAPACPPGADGPRLRAWTVSQIDGVPFYVTRLRAGDRTGPAWVEVAGMRCEVTLLPPFHEAPDPARSVLRLETAPDRVVIEPRDARGHLLGSGVRVDLWTDPPLPAPLRYIGAGQYAVLGRVEQARATLDGTVALWSEGAAPAPGAPEAASGCATGGRMRGWGVLLAALVVPWLLRRRRRPADRVLRARIAQRGGPSEASASRFRSRRTPISIDASSRPRWAA